ncbi:uncharacterized protein PAC_04005 [Phialocephala subalpina]|uniref:DUF7905 domain-containing protein n=1 Tax=Phialocephala subalpina TaxID=576137 RepID=A0A1L7WMY1_9HELO|nr:uncharacterized protein PAC_04005 [Phialocephala subalpina]
MSTYDRPYYHARSNVASTAYSKSTAIPKERNITFASEWHFHPEGVALVRERFKAFLAENRLNASLEWDDQSHSFRLRCRAEYSSQISAGFYGVLRGIIKQELKNGFKGNKPPYQNGDDEEDDDDDDDDDESSAPGGLGSQAPTDEGDAVPEDELEELELDVSEALNSRLIRRLALWEEESRGSAKQNGENTSPASQTSIVAEEEYPSSLQSYKFHFKWSACAHRPSRLEKIAPAAILEELGRLTGCDFQKQVNKGILYIGSNDEQSLDVVIYKLDNLIKNRKSFYCVNHFFYSEGHEKVKFALVPFTKIKKFYFATTILDNLHVIINGGLIRKAGDLLPPDWQTLADSVTARCAHWDHKNGDFELVKRVDISVISDSGAGLNFKEWVNFKYSAKGELSDDPRRYYANPPTTEARPRQLLPAVSRSGTQASNNSGSSAQLSNSLTRLENGAVSQPRAPPADLPRVSGNSQKTLRIEQWATGVNSNGSVALTTVNGNNQVKNKKPLWDTYEEHDVAELLRIKKEKPAQTSSTLYSNISAMKRSTSTGLALAGQRAQPPVARQASQMPRSVSQPLGLFPAANTQASHESPTSIPAALANVANTSLVDLGIPSPTKEGRPTNPQFSQSFPENFRSRTILDDDVSMVGLPVLEPARQGEPNTEWTPMQPVKQQSVALELDEPLISFSPPLQPVNDTADGDLLDGSPLPEPITKADRGASGPSAIPATHDTLSQTRSQSVLDQIAQDEELAAKLQHEEDHPSDLNDALLAAQLQDEEETPSRSVDELLAAQYRREVYRPSPVRDAELAAQLQYEEEQGGTYVGGTDVEKVQEDDEVASRTFHQTMNQKAGRGTYKGKKPYHQNGVGRLPVLDPPQARVPAKNEQDPEDPVPEFVAGITENFSGLMNAIRPFRGQLVVQVEFGRIIMRDFAPSNVFHKSRDKMFKNRDLQTLLLKPTEHGPFCFFTNVLTLLPADMQYLVAIKNKKEKPLWQPTSTWSVTYEFHFRDLSVLDSPFFLVQVDGETFKTEIKVPRELGSIYCHGTMRHWDFRIAATGYEITTAVKEKYDAVREAIEKTLYIPPDMKTPLLLWEMQTALSHRFQLQELQVKRVLKYQSDDRRSILKVIEVQSLDIQGGEVPGKSISVFQGAPGPNGEPPTEKLRQWWEANISSPDADEVLEENKALELGDEPEWTTDTLSKMHVASALYLPACEMLKKMDPVGQLNRNGIERAVFEMSNATPKEKKSQVVDKDGFW